MSGHAPKKTSNQKRLTRIALGSGISRQERTMQVKSQLELIHGIEALAEHLKAHPRSVYRWIEQGLPIRPDGSFYLSLVEAWFCSRAVREKRLKRIRHLESAVNQVEVAFEFCLPLNFDNSEISSRLIMEGIQRRLHSLSKRMIMTLKSACDPKPSNSLEFDGDRSPLQSSLWQSTPQRKKVQDD